jgi:hypothetical protein
MSMSTKTTAKIADVRGLRVRYQPGTLGAVRFAIKLADEGGTIQAHDMMRLTGDPTKHTATSLTLALASIGAEIVD